MKKNSPMVFRCIVTSVALVTLVLGSSMMEDEAVSRILRVPRVPAAAESAKGASGLLNYWRSCRRDAKKLGQTEEQAESTVIRLVVTPKTHLLANLAPQDTNKHPLYLGTPQSRALKADLVLDSLSTQGFSTALLQPNAELTVLNLNERNLQLKTDDRGKLTVNGVPGEVVETKHDGITVIALDDFLFDHRERIHQIRSGGNV